VDALDAEQHLEVGHLRHRFRLIGKSRSTFSASFTSMPINFVIASCASAPRGAARAPGLPATAARDDQQRYSPEDP
jgi:hypothetical protein